jgi:hypothetical protein
VTEITVAAVSAAAVLIGLVAWAVLSGQREFLSGWVLWVAVAGLAIIGLLVVIRVALPQAMQALAIALVGLGLSGVLVWLAARYQDQLPSGRTRQLIGLAVLGGVITILGAVAEMMRAGR